MKSIFQVSLLLVAIISFMIWERRNDAPKSSTNYYSNKTSHPSTQFAKHELHQNANEVTETKNEPTSHHISSIRPISLSTTEQAYHPSPQNLHIGRDLGLDEKTMSDLEFLITVERRERDFLLNTVRLSPAKYQLIQNRRRQVQQTLALLSRSASPKQAGYLRKKIISRHVHWMQSQIGVGYYHALQQIPLSNSTPRPE